MSSYSGGVSITQVSGFNSNPVLLRRLNCTNNNISLYNSGDAAGEIGPNTDVPQFFSQIGRFDGNHSIVVPANISAGIDLLNKTGKGFIGAIVLPVFAVASGNFTLTINIDGIVYTIIDTCDDDSRYVLVPSKVDSDLSGYGSISGITSKGTPFFTKNRLQDIGYYIAQKTALRFESSVIVRLSSTTAVSTAAENKTFGVQCLKDY